ncbi:MAG: hypothetical protein AAF664_23490 [Planctomycetota bacterium]
MYPIIRCCQTILLVSSIGIVSSFFADSEVAAQNSDVTPESLVFRRQAVRRMVFDRSEEIPLASLNPQKIVNLDLMHPLMDQSGSMTSAIRQERLELSAEENASSVRWIGGFNPFATYEIHLDRFLGNGDIGIVFRDTDESNEIFACINVRNGIYESIEWKIIKDGTQVDRQLYDWPTKIPTEGECRLRVQMLAVGVNLFIESEGKSYLVGYPDFSEHLELRRKATLNRFEFCQLANLRAGSSLKINQVTSSLTPGCGQADIRAITTSDGKPYLDQGRVWLTMTIRGRALPHPIQGVFSFNPSVFDLKFEGIIVFDIGDGLWRNELASHLFFDEESGQWRGWTTGFSAFGSKSQREEKAILAVWSDRDPRRGFSIMNARPVGIEGEHEDPHGVYDANANKWRLLLSERAGKYRAGMWESDYWDRGFERLAGPVEMDSTGTLIQTIGDSRYVFFGSADRKVYIRSYPDLEPIGDLKMRLPPWNKDTGTRIWPNVIPLPAGFPSSYIALMMDRVNYPDMPARNWTYGAMYLYHSQ